MQLGRLIYYAILLIFLGIVWICLLYATLFVLPNHLLKKAWLGLILLSLFIIAGIYSLIMDIRKYQPPKQANPHILDDDLII